MGKEVLLRHVSTDYFTCGICKFIIVEPVECRLCEQLYCNSCLIDYLNNSQDSCCPFGCNDPTFERAGHAFEKLMSFVYAKCKHNGCVHEDCIKYINKHELTCRFKQEKMEIEVPEDLIAQRDMFWLQILGRIMTPNQHPCFCAQTNAYVNTPIPSAGYSQNSNTPPGFFPITPRTQQGFKF